jgi:hypothetical protein
MNGPMHFPTDRVDEGHILLCSVQAVVVNTVGGDPTGKVIGGRLTLRAPSTIVKPKVKGSDSGDSNLTAHTLDIPSPGVRIDRKSMWWDSGPLPLRTEVDVAVVSIRYSDDDFNSKESHVASSFSLQMLVLFPLEENPACHRRVGVFIITTYFEENQSTPPANLLDSFGLYVSDKGTRSISVKEEAIFQTFVIE